MITTVFFDYFGVLSSDEYYNFTGVDKQKRSDFHQLADEVNSGHLHWQDFVAKLAEQKNVSIEEVNAIYQKQRVNRQLSGLVDKLRQSYQVGLLSNASAEYLRPKLQAAGLDKALDPVVISSEVQAIKPQPEIYKQALNMADSQAAESLLIDDMEINVQGAKDVGMEALLYTDFKTLLHELKDRIDL